MNIGPCCWCAVVESESPNIVSNPNWNWSNSVVLSCITHFGPEKIMAGLLLARFVFLFFLLFVCYHLLSSVIRAVGWEIENAADSLGQTFSNTQKFQGIAPNEWNSCWEFLAGKLVTFLRNHIDSLQTQHHHPTATTAEREKTFFLELARIHLASLCIIRQQQTLHTECGNTHNSIIFERLTNVSHRNVRYTTHICSSI